MDPKKTPTAIHMMHSSSSIDADLICLEITRVVNKLADFLAIEALIIVFDVYMHYTFSPNPTSQRHYFI